MLNEQFKLHHNEPILSLQYYKLLRESKILLKNEWATSELKLMSIVTRKVKDNSKDNLLMA